MYEELMRRLECPKVRADVVLDTDTFNEIDDQFALSYMLASKEKLDVKAIYAAPFFNQNSSSPEDGMRRSYAEILTLLTLAGREDLKPFTFEGSCGYLIDETHPALSPAAEDLAARAMSYSSESPLYVVAIGAITNVASAILLNPKIIDRIVIVWLGGNALEWPDSGEFNMKQDVAAARVVMGCGAAFVQLPCSGVVDQFRTTGPELDYWLKGKNALCDYLVDATHKAANEYAEGKPWSRVIWDVVAVGWLLNDGERFMKSRLVPAPIPEYDDHYGFDMRRHPICYVWCVHRDHLMDDLFKKLAGMGGAV